jgi:zinc transport system ATP-binding protein
MATEHPAIEIQDLDYAYERQPVLTGVELSIEQQDFALLLGPNGGGKSTLLKILAGILPVKNGLVRVMGKSPREHLFSLGYVPQEVQVRAGFPVSALEVVMMGLLTPSRRLSFSKKEQKRALAALDLVGMADHAASHMPQMSGGQRQRVLIARALAGEPRLLLLDEPVSSVDQNWQGKLFDLLKELNRDTTILMVSHDLSVVSSHVKSVVCVNRQVFYHPRPEITSEMLAKTYCCPVELVAHGLPHRVLEEHHHHHHHQDEPDA